MKNWIYNNNEVLSVNDLPSDGFGFVYIITNNSNNKIYIGKKYLFYEVKTKIGITEKTENKKLNIWKDYKYVKRESDWKKYWGSNKDLIKEYKENPDIFSRSILRICFSKKELTYWEVAYQFAYDVLFSNSYNDNILGKFYSKDFK